MNVSDWAAVATIIGVPIAFFAAWIVVFTPIKEQMKGDPDRKLYLKTLSQPRFGAIYTNTLDRVLESLDHFFGKKLLLSGKSFDRCFTISYIYSFAFFYIGWLVGGSGQIGKITLLHNVEPLAKIISTIALAGCGGAVWLIFRLLENGWVEQLLERSFVKLGWSPSRKTLDLLETVVVVVGVVVVGGGVGGVVGVVGVGGVVGGGLGGVGLGIVVGVVVGGVVGLGVVVGGGFVVVVVGIGFGGVLRHYTDENLTLLVFFFILPLTNALLDWLSWGFSRGLGRKVQRLYSKNNEKMPIVGLAIHAIGDFLIAVVLLLGMAVVLVLTIELFNILAHWQNQPSILELKETLTALKTAPFGAHAWVTFMLVTTLLPTAGHFVMVIFAMVVRVPDIFGFRQHAHKRLNDYHIAPKGKRASQLLTPAAVYLSSSWILSLACLILFGWVSWWSGSAVIGSAAKIVWEAANQTMLWCQSFYLP